MSGPLAKIFWKDEFLLVSKVEVFGKDCSGRCLCRERHTISRLLPALPFLVVISTDPHIWNVIVEYFSQFVNDTGSDLWTNFGGCYQATHLLYFAFVNE